MRRRWWRQSERQKGEGEVRGRRKKGEGRWRRAMRKIQGDREKENGEESMRREM